MPPSTEACVTHTGFAGPFHSHYVRRVQCLRLCTTRRKTTDNYREQICVDTAGTVLVPRAGHFQCYNMNIFFQIKYTEAILSNSTRKLLWFEITEMLIAVLKSKFIALFIIIFGTLSFPIAVR